MTVLSCLSYHQAIMNLVQFAANGHIDTHKQVHTHSHTLLSHIVDHVWFSCSLALTLIQSRLVEICSPCCLIFPPLATFPGTAPLPHRVAQAGLAWPQRACQVCSLSSSSSNLFPYARSMDSVLQITRAPLPPATAWIQETFNLPVCLLQKGAMLPRPTMCHSVCFFSMIIVLCSKLGYLPYSPFQVELKESPLKISFWHNIRTVPNIRSIKL